MSTIRIVVVEDQPLWQELLLTAIAEDARLEVVGVASDGDTAVKLAREKQPDAILMDIEILGEMNGIEAGLLIKEERPETAIVILSSHMERGYITSLPLNRSAGWAYILKQTVHDLDTVVRTVQEAMRGMVVLDPRFSSAVSHAAARRSPPATVETLTRRELEVLRLLAEGSPNKAIAYRLDISEHTVKFHVNSILTKLNAQSRTEAVTTATRLGLILL